MGLMPFLRHAVECYEKDPNAAWVGLECADSQIQFQLQEDATERLISPKEEKEALTDSRRRTAKEMRRKLLEHSQDGVLSSKGIILADTNAKPEPFDFERFEKRQYEAFLSLLVSVCRHEGIDTTKEELVKRYAPEQILSLKDDLQFRIAKREYELAQIRKPDFETYLTRRMLDWIEEVANDMEESSPIAFRQAIPDHLKQFIYEARWCNLHGLHAACTALCGAILQEAIRIKLGRESYGGLGAAIQDANKKGLLTSVNDEKAKKLKDLRDDAAHGNCRFFESPEQRTKSALADTIEILNNLFP